MTDLVAEQPPPDLVNHGDRRKSISRLFKEKLSARDTQRIKEDASDASEPSEKLLSDPEKGDKLVTDIKKAVFDEYDRALLEGTSSKEEVEINKKHVETVHSLAMMSIDGLREKGIDVTDSQRRKIEIYVYLHDAMKIVPERSDKKGRYGPKHAREQSGDAAWLTKLLRHGEDSAEWADQWLEDKGFSKEFIKQAKKDLIAHMGMPFVETKLDETKDQLGKIIADGSDKNRMKRIKTTLPETLAENGKYPKPETMEAAVLRAADFLSAGVMAGNDLDKDPASGSFDKYVSINLSQGAYLGEACLSAYTSVHDNTEALSKPAHDAKNHGVTPTLAETVESTIVNEIGAGMRDKFVAFVDFVSDTVAPDITEASKEKVGNPLLSQLTVDKLNTLTVLNSKGQVDTKQTMVKYYELVGKFRDKEKTINGEFDPQNNILDC